MFDEVGEEWVDVHGDVWDSADRAGLKFVIELGKKIHGLSPAQEKLWLQSISPIIIEYQAKMEKKGLPAKKAVKVLRELIAINQ